MQGLIVGFAVAKVARIRPVILQSVRSSKTFPLKSQSLVKWQRDSNCQDPEVRKKKLNAELLGGLRISQRMHFGRGDERV